MKICYLADAGSIHTQKWAIHFASKGNEIHIISFRDAEIDGVIVHHFDSSGTINISPSASIFEKIRYLFWVKRVKDLILKIKPDILHAHWATSYGLLAALSGFHPFILSVWGSDVILFPKKLWITKKILKFNLSRADVVTATSNALAKETMDYISGNKQVHVIPFGVNINQFYSINKNYNTDEFCVGIVKTLEKIYGIKYLILAVEIVIKKGYKCHLIIVGDGSLRKKLVQLCDEIRISNFVTFTGKIPNHMVVSQLHSFDVFVVPSLSESFGVSAIEASACSIPVIASNIGGLPEVVINGKTGYLVPPGDAESIAEKIIKLIEEPSLRQRLGKGGRKYVLENYEWNSCAKKMEEIYERILD